MEIIDIIMKINYCYYYLLSELNRKINKSHWVFIVMIKEINHYFFSKWLYSIKRAF